MAYSVYKVLIPFYRADWHPVKMQFDLIFIEGLPFAVLSWSDAFDGTEPTRMLKLKRQYLRKDVTGTSDYVYQRVMKQPQPQFA